MTVYQTNQHSLISFLAEIVLQVPHSVHGPSVMDGPHHFTKSPFQAPDVSLGVGSLSNSYANQKIFLPWLARSGGDGVHVILGIKVAIDKSVKDGVGESILWRSHLFPLEPYPSPKLGGILAANKWKLLN